MPYQPLGRRVLVQTLELEEHQTEGGIVLPTVRDRARQQALVVAVGPQVDSVRRGDRVVHCRYAGLQVDPDLDHRLRLMDAGDLICVIEKD